jgi:hypothetical protein
LRWTAAKRAIAARIAEAVRDAYGNGGGSAAHACAAETGRDWCRGADVPGALFTDAWAGAANWD